MVVGGSSGKLSLNHIHAILPTPSLSELVIVVPYVFSKNLELNEDGTAVSVDKSRYGS